MFRIYHAYFVMMPLRVNQNHSLEIETTKKVRWKKIQKKREKRKEKI